MNPTNLACCKVTFSSLNFFWGSYFSNCPLLLRLSFHACGQHRQSAGCREPGQARRCVASDPTEVWVQAAILRPVVAYLHIKKFITPLLLPHCSFFFFCSLMLPCTFWVQAVLKNTTLISTQLHQEWNRPEILQEILLKC